MKEDPIENNPEYTSILNEVNKKANRMAAEKMLDSCKKSIENINLTPQIPKSFLEEKISKLENFLDGKTEHVHIIGFSHSFWAYKKEILDKEYNIKWNSPQDLNPKTMFD